MNDIKGNQVNVGDTVIYTYKDKHLDIGKVTKIYGNGFKCSVDGRPNIYASRIMKLHEGRQQNIVAMYREGGNVQVHIFPCIVLSGEKDFDLMSAAKEAVEEYLHTQKGKALYEYNCGCFNWGDFWTSLPNSFCRNHGFEKADASLPDICVDHDEHLIDDFKFDRFWKGGRK